VLVYDWFLLPLIGLHYGNPNPPQTLEGPRGLGVGIDELGVDAGLLDLDLAAGHDEVPGEVREVAALLRRLDHLLEVGRILRLEVAVHRLGRWQGARGGEGARGEGRRGAMGGPDEATALNPPTASHAPISAMRS